MDKALFVSRFPAWLSRSAVSESYAVLYIVNYAQLLHAYADADFPSVIEAALKERLSLYGISEDDVLMLGYCILLRFSTEAEARIPGDGLFPEKLDKVLSYAPVQYGEHHFFLHLRAAWFGSVQRVAAGCPASFFDLKAVAGSIAFTEAEFSTPEQISSEMAQACRFFRQLGGDEVALSFQPIRFLGEASDALYYEVLLRRADPDEYVSCGDVIASLERLRLIERLDASVLWTVVQVLQAHPGVHLGCNLSALSLRRSSWWRAVLAQLHAEPGLARRLTLEITETSCVVDLEEASAALQELRDLGCRIALDDMVEGSSTLMLAKHLQPDIIKLDKTLLHAVRTSGSVMALQSLIDTLSSICRYVVVEGVESERDLDIGLNAGAHAAQGYFVGSPSLRPPWLAAPVFVNDFFKPASLAMPAASYSQEKK